MLFIRTSYPSSERELVILDLIVQHNPVCFAVDVIVTKL